jgi:hypothetical protein
MPQTPEPVHLSNHHRRTLREVFQHPVSHNIEWRAVASLLEAVGSVTIHHDGKVGFTVGSRTEVFDARGQKDLDTQQVLDMRELLSAAGYGAMGAAQTDNGQQTESG